MNFTFDFNFIIDHAHVSMMSGRSAGSHWFSLAAPDPVNPAYWRIGAVGRRETTTGSVGQISTWQQMQLYNNSIKSVCNTENHWKDGLYSNDIFKTSSFELIAQTHANPL